LTALPHTGHLRAPVPFFVNPAPCFLSFGSWVIPQNWHALPRRTEEPHEGQQIIFSFIGLANFTPPFLKCQRVVRTYKRRDYKRRVRQQKTKYSSKKVALYNAKRGWHPPRENSEILDNFQIFKT